MRLFVYFALAVASIAVSHAATPGFVLSIQKEIENGDLTDALRRIDNGLVKNSRDGGLLNLRGIVLAKRNEVAAARRDFSSAVRYAPQLAPAWQNLARACRLEEDTACEYDASLRVLRLRPGDPEATESLARTVRQRETWMQEARLVDQCLQGRGAEAKVIAIRLGQNADFSESDLGRILPKLIGAKCAAAAAGLIEGLDQRQLASTFDLQQLALRYETLGQVGDARKVLERVALLDSGNPAHLVELARLAELSKDHEGALSYLAHARDLAPNDARMHALFAKVAMEMELPVEARRSLDRALELDPENPKYHYALGAVILTTRDAATASSHFERFVLAHPDDFQGHYALGIAYFASGDYEKSTAQMNWVVEHSKEAAGAEYFLGRMARINGDLAVAIQHLEKSIACMPAYAESHTELARVWMEMGKLIPASQELEHAVQIDPQSFQSNAQLLVLYQRTHDPRAKKQSELLKQLDESRSKRSELMLRTIQATP